MSSKVSRPGPEVASRQAGKPRNTSWKDPLVVWGLAAFIVLVGAGATTYLVQSAAGYEALRVHREFGEHAEDQLDRLEKEIYRQLDSVEELASFFRSHPNVDRQGFAVFAASTLARHPGVQALEWAPRVTAESRAAFVAEARRDIPDFEFRHRAPDGSLVVAPAMDEFFPVLYVEPIAENERALGFAPTDVPERDEAIGRAIDYRSLALSAPIRLVQGREEPAIMAFSPVFAPPPGGDGDRLLGVAEAVFWVDRLLEGALDTSRLHGVHVRLADLSSDSHRELYPGGSHLPETGHDHLLTKRLRVGGRLWEIQATAAPGYFQHDKLVPRLVAVSGAIASLALAALIGMLLQRERHVSGMVAVRTEELAFQAAHDPLTGLINRREFDNRLTEAIAHCQADGAEHALLYLDLDQFKVINDSCGHAAGDEMLKQLARKLRQTIRDSDVLARLGGDEFGILLSGCSPGMETAPTQKILEAIRDSRFAWSGRTFAIGGSIGIVHLQRQTESAAVALSQADAACYIAKERGRNRFHLFHDEDTASGVFQRQLEWVAELRDAVEKDHFALLAQPIRPCSLEEGGPFAEIMLVLDRPKGHRVPAIDFVPAAERYGLMSLVDRWVIRNTVVLLGRFPAERGVFSINISGQSIGEDGFCDFVEDVLDASNIDPQRLCFELTETAAVANLVVAQTFIRRLRRRGCRFALDDFGSGMSSFQYLRQLPVDFVKIDGSFVRAIASDSRDRAVVAAIHEIARVHRVQTIAEFVESKEILTILRRVGVHWAQGFFLGEPAPLEAVLAARSAQPGLSAEAAAAENPPP